MAGAAQVSGALIWLLVALGLAVVVVRRRSVAVGLVTVQALVLAVEAVRSGTSDATSATVLAIRAVALGTLLLLVVSRTREPRPVRAGIAPFARGGLAVGLALALTWLVPAIGLESRNAERGVLALIAFGVTAAATRRATLFAVLAIVLCENGLALAALELPRGSSTAIECGVAFDLTLVALVAAVFHERIFAEFGAGDTAALRSLRE